MKRCNESFISTTLHPDIYEVIYLHMPPETKHSCSLVDKKLYGVSSSLARQLSFTTQGSEDLETVYVDLLKRYPNIEEIYFESCENEKQIRYLAQFLNEEHEKHPLSRVKTLDVIKPQWVNKGENLEFLGLFLKNLAHPGLESFTWKDCDMFCTLTHKEVQPLLDRAVNLTYLRIEAGLCHTPGNPELYDLSFNMQSKLASIALNTPFATINTFASLNSCDQLESLTLKYNTNANKLIPTLNNKTWKLKHVDVELYSDFSFTRKMPDLSSLIMRASLEDHHDLEELGRNCKDLKKLEMIDLKVDSEKIKKLLQGLPKLELFTFSGSNECTDELKEVVKINCPLLTNSSFSTEGRWKVNRFYPANSQGFGSISSALNEGFKNAFTLHHQ